MQQRQSSTLVLLRARFEEFTDRESKSGTSKHKRLQVLLSVTGFALRANVRASLLVR